MCGRKPLLRLCWAHTGSSQKASFLEQEQEWADLGRGGVSERSLGEPSIIPELKPLEVVRSVSDIILVTMVLEVKLLVTPEGGGGL